MSDLKTHTEILKAEGVDVNKLAKIDPNLYSSIIRAMGEFADQYHSWKKANEARKSAEQALHKHIVRHSCDMISDEYIYKKHFRFQRMLKDGRWYVTYNNFIITHGQYRHDLEQWIDSNYA